MATYKRIFEESGVEDGWKDVVAVVVQPGVEFGDDQVFLYNHDAATELCSALKEYPEVCFEAGRKNCISLLRRAACHPHDSVSASWQAVPA